MVKSSSKSKSKSKVVKKKIYNPQTKKTRLLDPNGAAAKRIYEYQIEKEGIEAVAILPLNLTYDKDKKKVVGIKRIQDTNNINRITYEKFIADGGADTLSYLRDKLKRLGGQTVKLTKRYTMYNSFIDKDEQFQDSITTEIPKTGSGYSKWWTKNSSFFIIDSDIQLFSDDLNTYDNVRLDAQLLILTAQQVKRKNVNQYFLDGDSHCYFTPIKDWANNKFDEATSKTGKKRYKTILNKVDKYLIEYKDGVPNDAITGICDNLQIGIQIDLPSPTDNKIQFIKAESSRKSLKQFKFINTRLNHIELNEYSNITDYEEVDKKTLKSIYNDYDIKNQYILWKENSNGITQINTLDNIYKLKPDEDSYIEVVKEFEKKYNFRQYEIDKKIHPELCDFLECSLNCNNRIGFVYNDDYETLDRYYDRSHDKWEERYNERKTPEFEKWVEGLENLKHIDMKKAYTQGHNCNFYQGYLGKISDFRKTDKIVGLGIYRIKNINFNGCDYIKNMNCLHNNLSYTSPELEFYQKLGITFDIDMGCWGTSYDFEFDKSMLKKEQGVSHYCKFYGCLQKTTKYNRYYFRCKDIEFAELNNFYSKGNIRYNKENNLGLIEYEKEQILCNYQLATFIASYSRITLLEQIMKFKNFNQIYNVVVDGIYYIGDVEVDELFVEDKKQKSLQHTLYDNYFVMNDVYYDGDCPGDFKKYNQIEINVGPGGCGKTHNNIIDKGLINTYYLAPSWKLSKKKNEEYGIKNNVYYNILSQDPEKWGPIYRKYSVLIIDEISMLNNEEKNIIIERFDKHKIIFCGDVGYQLPPVAQGNERVEEFNLTEKYPNINGDWKPIPVIHHNTNFRCKDKKLKEVLDLCRLLIECKSKDFYKIFKYFDIIDKDEIDYKIEDLIISKTNLISDNYTEKYKHLEKYIVKNNTRDYNNGEIIFKKPEDNKVKCLIKHGFTIHIIQGETAESKLYIDINKINSMRMLYTAISRAQYLKQIILIK